MLALANFITLALIKKKRIHCLQLSYTLCACISINSILRWRCTVLCDLELDPHSIPCTYTYWRLIKKNNILLNLVYVSSKQAAAHNLPKYDGTHTFLFSHLELLQYSVDVQHESAMIHWQESRVESYDNDLTSALYILGLGYLEVV